MSITLNDPRIPQNWHQANTFLGKRDERKAGNNTTVERTTYSDSIYVRLHSTIIVEYFGPESPNHGSVLLNSGGWHSVTTKQRMNLFTHLSIYQRDFVWYVVEPRRTLDGRMVWHGQEDDTKYTHEFEDYGIYRNTPKAA